MTLRLILTRHAKSDWGDPTQSDHDRPLNMRGRKSAELVGKWLVSRGVAPSLVLSSDAARTRETWDYMAPAFETAPRLDWRSELYLGSAQTMLDCLKGAMGRTVLLLGHNPGIAQFASMIVARHPVHQRFKDYPTGATLIAEFDLESWSIAEWGQGVTCDFTVPRELE